ncbi:mechanosensitive ion channel domain-containing protein [Halodesulfurarchaeum sp.]|uniref:mechanosensitive ion channel domain-containing protein n=1 Tax=Halodesulfurarchaeum sp. TaxID=1980530 RepID=UPI002FC32837
MADLNVVQAIETRYLWAGVILLIGFGGGYVLGQLNRRILGAIGLKDAVEGTSLERTARNFGTETVTILARGSAWLIYAFTVVLSLQMAELVETSVLISRAFDLLPSYVLAVLVIMGGLLVGDKVEMFVDERLKGVKFPEITLIGRILRYTVIFIAILLALAQIGVAVGVLIILLGAYLLAGIVFVTTALHQLLASAGAGLYLLLVQPFSIGDRVAIGEREGVVQEIDLFVTSIEADGRVFLVPNHLVLKNGATMIRD